MSFFFVTRPDGHFLWKTKRVKNKTETESVSRGGGVRRGEIPVGEERKQDTHMTCDGGRGGGRDRKLKCDDASRGSVVLAGRC